MSKCQIDTDPLYLSVCNKGTKGCTVAHKTVSELEYLLSASQAREAALQAKIDALMLEYCPDEMTPEQLENWGRHQKPSPETNLDEALRRQ